MKKGDFLVLLLILTMAGGIFIKTVSMVGGNDSSKEIVISVDGKEYKRMGINENEYVEIVTERGRNVVGVENGKARMVESSCPDQLCVKMGNISEINQSIVCLPNRVVITIVGSNTVDDVDVVLY